MRHRGRGSIITGSIITGSARRRAPAATGALLATLLAAAGALAACGTAPASGADATTPVTGATTPSGYGWFAYAPPSGATDTSGRPLVAHAPPEVLDLAGMHLPAGVEVRGVATQSVRGAAESFLFVVRADRATALSLCDQAGLGGARRVTSIPGSAAESMRDPVAGPGSRWCERADTGGERWARYVLIGPGDPATVQLSIQRP